MIALLTRSARLAAALAIMSAIAACAQEAPGVLRFEAEDISQPADAWVENRESAAAQLCKEFALWRVALAFGFVFDVDDFVAALQR